LLQVNDKVVARWKGGSYFNGKITAVNSDGTYAIKFDDGDIELNEPLEHIRFNGRPTPGQFLIGDLVLARWKGGGAFRGKVSSVNGDGTYGIAFLDGDVEAREPASDITLVERGTPSAAPSGGGSLAVGSRVEARWKGGSYYPGKISAVNGDGTYCIDFDDGCKESQQLQADIKLL